MTQHNIFQEVDEDLERQRLEAIWKRYGGLIIVGAVVIVLATAGVSAWNTWQTQRSQKASAELVMIMSKHEPEAGKEVDNLATFAAQNHGTAQATIAQLQAASLASKSGDTAKAVQLYDGVANDTKADAAFRQLADLLAVRAQMDSGNPAVLEQRLHPLLAENAPFRYTAMEYDGYLALKSGDKAKAKQIFTELSQDASVPKSLSIRAADMLRFIGE